MFEIFVIIMSIVNSYLDRTKATESGLLKLIEEADMLFSWKQQTAFLKENWCESFWIGDLCSEHSKYITEY